MFHHNLLQTNSKALAFFSGKSPEHTWRGDVSDRFQVYLDNYLQDNNDIENNFREEYNGRIPKTIPFYLKPQTTVKSKTHSAQVIIVYVGQHHYDLMNKIILKVPFEDIELVPMSIRQSNAPVFDQQVQLHKFLGQDCSVVKLKNTSKNLRTFLKADIRWDSSIGEHVIDVAEASSTTTEGALYVQCLATHKESIIAHLEKYLKIYSSKYPNDGAAVIVYPRTSNSNNFASATQTLQTWSKNQAYFYSHLANPKHSKQKPPQPIPGATNAISFADMVAGRYQYGGIKHMQLEMSSLTNSCTMTPSLQEKQ